MDLKSLITNAFLYLASLILICSESQAAIIKGELSHSGPNFWQVHYSIDNNSGLLIEEFELLFAPDLFSNIQVIVSPSDWDYISVQPDTLLNDNGVVDFYALGLGLDTGSLLSGFTLSFEWLGSGLPQSQAFNILDPLDFSVLSSGIVSFSQPSNPANPVPEPYSPLIMAMGLAILFKLRVFPNYGQ